MSWTRRDFVAAGIAAGSLARAGANDRIRVGIIGNGGRSRDHIAELTRIPGVEIAAVADPDDTLTMEKSAAIDKLTGHAPSRQRDLRRILDDKNIDAVTIACCNHWHALAAIWALQAGKHVYVEKPVCHDLFSGMQMVAASRRYGRMAQGGTQRRSNEYIRRAFRALRDGVIGDVYMARCIHFQDRPSLGFRQPQAPPTTLDWDLWLGPARQQEYHANLHPYNWHWFWDFGNGELGNNGVHFIDLARWGLNRRWPSKITSTGGRFGYHDQGQTPNTQLTTYQFEDGVQLVVEIRNRYTNREQDLSSGVIFYGSKGYMISEHDRACYEVYLEGSKTPGPVYSAADDPERIDDRKSTGAHFRNFFSAVRSGNRESLNADIEETFLSTGYCLLGNIAFRRGHQIRVDPATGNITGDVEAARMARDVCREAFKVPDRV